MSLPSIAIIGAGPAGIATAKYLKQAGLAPVVFEQSSRIGGQWNAGAPHSGIWPSMRANTSSATICFSDLAHPPGTAMFPTHQEVRAYLERYVDKFGLRSHLRLGTRVMSVQAGEDGGWILRTVGGGAPEREEVFSHVVIASGRFNKPLIPRLPGLSDFAGAGGVSHAFSYRGQEAFRGRRVLVVGNNISGLEIAADLAADPSITVFSACRKPRYIVSKILAGVPADLVAFSRFASLLGRAVPPSEAAEGLKQLILRHCGNPAQYGAPRPSDNLLQAGITQCQNYLPFVAEGRIRTRPQPVDFGPRSVRFADGTEEPIDAVIFGTGYSVNLPFLDAGLRRTLGVDEHGLDLYHHTFHPDVPGLAFVGLYSQVGPLFPVLELQARWLAMVWSDVRALPDRGAMRAAIDAHHALRQVRPTEVAHDMALLFSEAAGVAPRVARRPRLARALMFGPLVPSQFRLDGRDALPDAEQRYLEAVASFGCMTSHELSAEEHAGLEMLARTLKGEPWLAELLAQLPPPKRQPASG